MQGDGGGLIVIDRMLERLQLYQQYAQYWRERPQVGVSGHASHWWRHAGSAAVQQCLQLSRRQVPPCRPQACPDQVPPEGWQRPCRLCC